MTQEHTPPSLWERIKSGAMVAWNWTLRYPLALVIATLVIVVAVVLLLLGFGDAFNVGGILGWLFGHDEADKDPELEVKVNKIPPKRKDTQGELIEVGEPDEHGFTQREITVVDRKKNPFRDRNVLEVSTVEGETKKLRLPTGVKDTDVERVILTQPGKVEIHVIEAPKEVSQDLIDKLS